MNNACNDSVAIIDCFLNNITDGNLIKKLNDIFDIGGFGYEFAACQFSFDTQKGDEDYFGDKVVKISLDRPLYHNDITIIVTYELFFERLCSRIEQYILKHPSECDNLYHICNEIKKLLEI